MATSRHRSTDAARLKRRPSSGNTRAQKTPAVAGGCFGSPHRLNSALAGLAAAADEGQSAQAKQAERGGLGDRRGVELDLADAESGVRVVGEIAVDVQQDVPGRERLREGVDRLTRVG